MDSDKAIIELTGVTKAFGDTEILRGVDFRVGACEVVAILGASGSGKSLLLRLMLGLASPEAGRITLLGHDITAMAEVDLLRIRRQVGMVFQGGALFDSLTVGENVAYPLREHTRLPEAAIRARVEELLAAVGLRGTEGMTPPVLSGGMRKRVAIARALALAPEVVLYDEPTAGLDPPNATRINLLIAELQRRSCTAAVVVTHDLQRALEVADRLTFLDEGRLAFCGSPAEFLTSRLPAIERYAAAEDRRRLEAYLTAAQARHTDSGRRLRRAA